jgi:hypothetical protein
MSLTDDFGAWLDKASNNDLLMLVGGQLDKPDEEDGQRDWAAWDAAHKVGRRPEWVEGGDFDKQMAEEHTWKAKIRHGLAMGHITPAEATAHGYFILGHEATVGWEPLPHDLYHVTTNHAAVVASGGLKSRDELNMGLGHGLGGGESHTISYTDDLATAHAIKNAMLEARQVARGEITPKELLEGAKKGDKGSTPFEEDLLQHWNSKWKKGDELPQGVQALLAGKKVKSAIFTTPEEFRAEHGPGWEPAPWSNKIEVPKGTVYTHYWRDATPEEKRDDAMGFYKHFSTWRSVHGGPEDPLFFLSDAQALANTKESDIQVVHVKAKPGAHGYRLSALGEWRSPTGDNVELQPETRSWEAWDEAHKVGRPRKSTITPGVGRVTIKSGNLIEHAWVDPPDPTGLGKRKTNGFTAIGITNTALGDAVENALIEHLGMSNDHPGRRQGPLDLTYGKNGYEVKAVSTSAKEYKAKPAKDAVERKVAYAKANGINPHTMVVVYSPEDKQLYVYSKPGIGAYRLTNPSQGWKFHGTVPLDLGNEPDPAAHPDKIRAAVFKLLTRDWTKWDLEHQPIEEAHRHITENAKRFHGAGGTVEELNGADNKAELRRIDRTELVDLRNRLIEANGGKPLPDRVEKGFQLAHIAASNGLKNPAAKIRIARTAEGHIAAISASHPRGHLGGHHLAFMGSTGITHGAGSALMQEIARDASQRHAKLTLVPYDEEAARHWSGNLGAHEDEASGDMGWTPEEVERLAA